MGKYYPPKAEIKRQKPEYVKQTHTLPPCDNAGIIIRFVLKSGAALELKEETIDEVVGTWAERMCKTVCGCKADGTKVIIPIESVDYMEEANDSN